VLRRAAETEAQCTAASYAPGPDSVSRLPAGRDKTAAHTTSAPCGDCAALREHAQACAACVPSLDGFVHYTHAHGQAHPQHTALTG
jgi:hypothetical protein